MTFTRTPLTLVVTAGIAVSLGALSAASAQSQNSSTTNQPATTNRPGQQPQQPSQPRTQNPNPNQPNQQPQQPISPGAGQPGANPPTIIPPNDPNNPNGNNTNPNGTINSPDGTTNPNVGTVPGTSIDSARNLARGINRPFGFQSTRAEARFNTMNQRLATFESRMEKSNQEFLRKVGEARALTGDRQNRALLDLLQSLAQDRSDLQRYLQQSRGMYSGDDISDLATDPSSLEQSQVPQPQPLGQPQLQPQVPQNQQQQQSQQPSNNPYPPR